MEPEFEDICATYGGSSCQIVVVELRGCGLVALGAMHSAKPNIDAGVVSAIT
jgi:hypothetical protein